MDDLRRFQAVENWLQSAQPTDELEAEQAAALRELLGHAGLMAVINLMLGARQACFVQLAAIPLSEASNIARASVLQGKIQGIDTLRNLLLEHAIPANPEANAGAN